MEYILKTAAAATEFFSSTLRKQKKDRIAELFWKYWKSWTKNERTDRQTIEQGVLADVALCSMNMERDAVQEMYGAGKISYGTSVSMKMILHCWNYKWNKYESPW